MDFGGEFRNPGPTHNATDLKISSFESTLANRSAPFISVQKDPSAEALANATRQILRHMRQRMQIHQCNITCFKMSTPNQNQSTKDERPELTVPPWAA